MMRIAIAGRRPRRGAPLTAVGLMLCVTACSGLLDVYNLKRKTAYEIHNPRSAAALLSGVHSSVSRAINAVTLVEATASDELDWVGSRDAWRALDFGNLSDPFNEFTEAAFPHVAQARWFADAGITNKYVHWECGRLVDDSLAAGR